MQTAALEFKLQNRYRIQSKAGAGGAGDVCIAWDEQLGRKVAVKRIRDDGAQEDAVKKTMSEAVRLASVRHINIVTVYDMGVEETGPYIVMEYVEGETVEQWVTRHGPLPEAEFLSIAYQSLEGLLAAHHARLLHCDLKPSNLMLERAPSGNLHVKILDFGIARFLSSVDPHFDKEGAVTGSVHCIAPEILSCETPDLRSDLYSLGCVFYYALTGRFPFDGENMADIIAAHLDHQVIDLAAYRPDLKPSIREWVMDLINRRPQDRYSSAMQALGALHDASADLTPAPAWENTAPVTVEEVVESECIAEPAAMPRPRENSRRLAVLAAMLVVAAGLAAWSVTHEAPQGFGGLQASSGPVKIHGRSLPASVTRQK